MVPQHRIIMHHHAVNDDKVNLLDNIRINLGIDTAGKLTLNRPW
jgi:hypothetical protein